MAWTHSLSQSWGGQSCDGKSAIHHWIWEVLNHGSSGVSLQCSSQLSSLARVWNFDCQEGSGVFITQTMLSELYSLWCSWKLLGYGWSSPGQGVRGTGRVFRLFPVLWPRQDRVNRILIYREARSLTLNDSWFGLRDRHVIQHDEWGPAARSGKST